MPTDADRIAADLVKRYWQAGPADFHRFKGLDVDIAQALTASAARVRDEALEEVARLAEANCAQWKAEGDGESVNASQMYYGMADAGVIIANAARELKGNK